MIQQKLSMRLIQEKSKQLNIPYRNLLAACAREWVLQCLYEGPSEKQVLVKRTSQLGLRAYRTGCFQDLYLCILDPELSEQDLDAFLSSRLKGICFERKKRNDRQEIHLKVEFDRITVPLVLYIETREGKKGVIETFPLKLIFENDKTLSLPCFYPEAELAELFGDFFSMLELYQDMAALETIYLYASGRNLNGKHVSLYLEEELEKRGLILTEDNVMQLEQALKNKVLQARYKGYLRSSKRKEPEFPNVETVIRSFFFPVLETMLKGQIFFGDWICDVQRYL